MDADWCSLSCGDQGCQCLRQEGPVDSTENVGSTPTNLADCFPLSPFHSFVNLPLTVAAIFPPKEGSLGPNEPTQRVSIMARIDWRLLLFALALIGFMVWAGINGSFHRTG